MYDILVEIKGYLAAALTTAFNKYYIGKVARPFLNEFPVLMIYGTATEQMTELITTAQDRYKYHITIEAIINNFKYTSGTEPEANKILLAQKALYYLMEERDTNMIPKATTVLGTIRRKIQGTKYFFNSGFSNCCISFQYNISSL